MRTAVGINPENAVLVQPTAPGAAGGAHPQPAQATATISKLWGGRPRTLTVSFLEHTSKELQDRIISHMNAWSKTCCIKFKPTSKVGKVRISFGPGGYWSYLGTDIVHIAPTEPTMNLEGFSMETLESEFHRVVRHETGHTLGFEHEHMRQELVALIDPQLAYPYFLKDQGWDRATVDAQVLTPLNKASIIGTPADKTSIMCYQLPGSIMKDGVGIVGGTDINDTDYAFAAMLYPKAAAVAAAPAAAPLAAMAPAQPDSADIRFSAALVEQFNEATLL